MKKLAHFGWNTLILGVTVLICSLLFAIIPADETVTSFGLFFMAITWALLYFSTYIIGYNRKSTFLNIVAAVINWIAVIIAVLGCLVVLIEHGNDFYRYAERGIAFNPFLNGLCVMWPFTALFSIVAYGLIQEEHDYERGILRIQPVSLVVGYVVALALSFLGLLGNFFYTWFFLILMAVIIVLLILLRDRIPDRLPILALLCKPWTGKGAKSKGRSSSSTYSAPTSSTRTTSSAPSARSIVSGLGDSSSSSSSSRPTSSSGSSSGSSASSGSIKKPTSSGSSGNNLGGNIGKLK